MFPASAYPIVSLLESRQARVHTLHGTVAKDYMHISDGMTVLARTVRTDSTVYASQKLPLAYRPWDFAGLVASYAGLHFGIETVICETFRETVRWSWSARRA